ncbi:hypothetical protein [Polaribacter sp. Asnod6-C07]|uniref:hypothetical protein n=1 Tax=Polaribacter sp. Asnod6-C07 TaxID=3160582 RepID=UPI003868C909
MAKQLQPKVSELVEILIQQVSQFEKKIDERNKILTESISKLKNIRVNFNVEELEEMKKSNRKILNEDFNNFHCQTVKNNKELLSIHKKISSKRLFYILFLNVFLFSIAGISIYFAIENKIQKTEFNTLQKENNYLNQYFLENQKESLKYKKWLDK